MITFKKWSKSEISLRTELWKFSIFEKILTQAQTSTNISIQQKNTKNTILRPAIHSQVRNDNVQKVVKIWKFAKDRGHENS